MQVKYGLVIKNFRAKYGLTQEQLGSMLNLAPSALSNYESGRRDPDNYIILALAYIDGVIKSEGKVVSFDVLTKRLMGESDERIN